MIIIAIHPKDPTLTTSNPGATSDSAQPAALPSLMPETSGLASCGDPGAELAALEVRCADEQRRTADKLRDEDLEAESKADAAEVQDMHDKADLQRAQGFVDGFASMAAGACACVAGVNDGSAAADTGSAQQADRNRSAGWNAASAGITGLQKLSDGLFSGAITDKDAAAKAHEASAAAFKEIADDAHDAERDAGDYMSKAVDFYKEYVDTKHQTVMAAIQRA